MKKNLFLYLFVFASLIALYALVTGNKKSNANDNKINELMVTITQLEDSLQAARIKQADLQYFSLDNNDDALAFYDHLGLENPTRYVEDKLMETNEQKGDNPLIPYEGMNSDFKLNKIKVLNHKWIVTDFSDGKYWGDLIIKYQINDDRSVDFTLMDHLLYSRSN
ncbi:hydrolase [Croceivirga radicis]|uniref:Hydrolase n=1 Tax=Croceivirga radicis TaxID=1929488 RepID=A0A1V6LS10_9FLAO|nr:hydrolase [Croceivirga radicis]OQD42955.1 hydrolase [Croceivirga radicis]